MPRLIPRRRWPRLAVALVALAAAGGAGAGLLVHQGRRAGAARSITGVPRTGTDASAGAAVPAPATQAPRPGPGASGGAAATVPGAAGRRTTTGRPRAAGTGPAAGPDAGVDGHQSVPDGLSVTPSTAVFGDAETTTTVRIADSGPAATFAVGPPPGWLTVSPTSGTVAAGGSATVVLTLDRVEAPVGALSLSLPVTASPAPTASAGAAAGTTPTGTIPTGTTLAVTAVVAAAPAVGAQTFAPAQVLVAGCPAPATTVTTLTVSVTDTVGVFGVNARVTLPDGAASTVALTLGEATGARSTWSGTLGPSPVAGTAAVDIVATGLDGRQAHASGTFTITAGCPAGATAGVATAAPSSPTVIALPARAVRLSPSPETARRRATG